MMSTPLKEKRQSKKKGKKSVDAGDAKSAAENPLSENTARDWLMAIFHDEAHLPKLGLPVKWAETQEKHKQILINLKQKKKFDLDKAESTKYTESRFAFIKSTPNKNPIPGTKAPDAVRFQRIQEARLENRIIKNARNEDMMLCMATGQFCRIAEFDSDHIQAAANIQERQKQLVQALNQHTALAKEIMALPGMEAFFRIDPEDNEICGTQFFYELYFNDIDNIWLISHAANLGKSDEETLAWLKKKRVLW